MGITIVVTAVLSIPLGQRVAGQSDQEVTITGSFSAKVLQDYRNQFPAWRDADKE